MMHDCNVLIIGGGPGGLAAAYGAKKEGAERVTVLERDKKPGGILNQCIHDGFGLIRYRETLTGPEYADRAIQEAKNAGAEILCSRHVSRIKRNDNNGFIVSAYTREGIEAYRARTIVLATGCRERTRGNISIPGSRSAGVFTAGVVQNLMNIRNIMPGKRVVILGSGDIGLIMARRLTLEGARVLAIAEIMEEPAGLARNVSQCVDEFNIPLYVRTTVSKIIGKKKLEAVELSDLDQEGGIIPGSARQIECDALVVSVGLIPENEVAQTIGIHLMENNAVETTPFLETNIHGVFSCGNSRHVMDLADYVSEQGELAGRNAVHRIKNEKMGIWDEEKTNCMKKGFPEEGSVTCTICPNGCQVKWDKITNKYSGNECPRGENFARKELTAPVRVVTTTVKSNTNNECGILVPVRSEEALGKEYVLDIVRTLKNLTLNNPIHIGDEVYTAEYDGSFVRILATANAK